MLHLIIYCFISLVLSKLLIVILTGKCTSQKCLNGKTAIVTGGSSGIGYETALDLAKRDCKVIIASSSNAEHIAEKITKETGNKKVFYRKVDLSSLDSVRKFADNFLSSENQLDILINNAGAAGFAGKFTDDGLLKIMQTNHLGPFLLTHLLLGLLKKSRGRIVFVSSYCAFFHCLNCENINTPANVMLSQINPYVEYSNSKLCNVISARIFAKKLRKHGILCFSVHPGVVWSKIYTRTFTAIEQSYATSLVFWLIYTACSLYAKTAVQGAQTSLHCALSENVENLSGEFFFDCIAGLLPPAAKNDDFCEKVWKNSEDLVGLKFEEQIESLSMLNDKESILRHANDNGN